MGFSVDGLELLDADLSVNAGRLQFPVAEELWDEADFGDAEEGADLLVAEGLFGEAACDDRSPFLRVARR